MAVRGINKVILVGRLGQLFRLYSLNICEKCFYMIEISE